MFFEHWAFQWHLRSKGWQKDETKKVMFSWQVLILSGSDFDNFNIDDHHHEHHALNDIYRLAQNLNAGIFLYVVLNLCNSPWCQALHVILFLSPLVCFLQHFVLALIWSMSVVDWVWKTNYYYLSVEFRKKKKSLYFLLWIMNVSHVSICSCSCTFFFLGGGGGGCVVWGWLCLGVFNGEWIIERHQRGNGTEQISDPPTPTPPTQHPPSLMTSRLK